MEAFRLYINGTQEVTYNNIGLKYTTGYEYGDFYHRLDNIENGVIYLIKDKNIDFWKGHNYAYISSLLKKYDENPEGYNEFEFFNNIKQAVNIKRKTLIILKERY